MKHISYTEILQKLTSDKLSNLPKFNVSILRNITVDAIAPYLKYSAYQVGFNLNCQFGEFDNVFQEAVGGRKDLLNENTSFVVVFVRLDILSEDIARKFVCLTKQKLEEEKQRIIDFIANVLEGIRRQTNAMVLWLGFELPIYPAMGVLDSQEDSGQTGTTEELNRHLRKALHEQSNCYFVDVNLALSRIGAKMFYDHRYWHIGKAPYSREALKEIASEIFKFIRPIKGKNKKCLVLDCDNVLWGGIVGEDGRVGIKLSTNYPGSSYYEFQQEIVNLYTRGIIIALCSKNNEEDVWDVFENHPDMVLKKKHIATAQINWNDKATNLRQIAADLNIGLESLVFVDDSDFEINLVQKVIPEIETIQLDKNYAVEYRELLAGCGWFDTLTLSEEDLERGAMYKTEAIRKNLKAKSTSLEEYYTSLEMILEIRLATEFTIPRIAQLTQKTNQFNLTTHRYSESEINEFSVNNSVDVICLKLKDCFGDMGIVGVSIIKYQADKATFDSFLLSCRALGRGVENAFIAQCLKRISLKGFNNALGEYIPTKKNGQVKDFFPKHGFTKKDEKNNICKFLMDLEASGQTGPAFFKLIDSDIDRV